MDMLFAPSDVPPDLAELETEPPFSVVVVYEDLEAGKHAQSVCDFLRKHLDNDCRFLNQMWKFDALAIPSLREMAAREAELADLILVSSHGTDELPADVKAWIDWLEGRGAAFAMVALFDRSNEKGAWARATQEYLARAARRGQMEFFAQPDIWPDGNQTVFQLARPAGRDLRDDASLYIAAVPTRNTNVRYWGLNE